MKRKGITSFLYFPYLSIAVIMIFVLIVIGLVIDLGGAPDHVRRGFEVCPTPSRFDVSDPFPSIVLDPPRSIDS